MVEGIQDGMFMLRDGKFEYVNQALTEMLGYSRKELLTMGFADLFSKDRQEEYIKNEQQILSMVEGFTSTGVMPSL